MTDVSVLRETEVDGVPTLLAPTSGPMQAGLVFRVGRADEILSRGGITHLVEHLALYGHGLTDYHYNGTTGATVTHFHMHGSEADVVAFLSGVCRSLANLPMDRLDTEKAILRTEAAGKKRGADDALPLWRYGARGYGLLSYPEWGLSELTPDDVRAWAAHWFTRENAVLWIAGDQVPAGLELALPSGARRPVPVPTSALPETPAFFAGSAPGVVFDAVVQRRTAASVYAGVLERELFRHLRQEGGYSYTAAAAYDPRGDGFATITAMADALPDKQDAVLGGFVDVLKKLEVGCVEQADIEAVRAKSDESLRHPEAVAAMLPGRAFNLVTGYPNRTLDELQAELHAVTIDDVRAVAVEATASALLMVPDCHDARWAGFTPAPTASTHAVEGSRYRSLEHDGDLVIGPGGVSLTGAGGPVTVPFDQCAALLAWPDGARQLIGHDGISLRVEPTLFKVKPDGLASIDAAVHPSVKVAIPARHPEAIPTPTPRTARRDGKPKQSRAKRLGKVLLGILLGLAGLFVLTVIAAAFGASADAMAKLILRGGCIGMCVAVYFAWRASRRE